MATLDLFSRPAEEGARLVALGQLAQARAALVRLAVPGDVEALHDFRVALRRLRSCLRAYRPVLAGSVPRRRRRKLRVLAAATGACRDTEVQLEWLRGVAKRKLPPKQRPGLTWLVERLEARRQAAYAEIRGSVGPRFETLAAKLAADLKTPARVGQAAQSFASVTASLLHEHAAELRLALARICGPADEALAHQARIRGKRLRYLLDPLKGAGGAVGPADSVVRQLKRLQEILGDLHDTAVLAAEVRQAVEDAAAAHAQTHDGLLALALLVRRRRDDRFADLAAGFLAAHADGFFAEAFALAAGVAALAPDGPAAPPRRGPARGRGNRRAR